MGNKLNKIISDKMLNEFRHIDSLLFQENKDELQYLIDKKTKYYNDQPAKWIKEEIEFLEEHLHHYSELEQLVILLSEERAISFQEQIVDVFEERIEKSSKTKP